MFAIILIRLGCFSFLWVVMLRGVFVNYACSSLLLFGLLFGVAWISFMCNNFDLVCLF